MSPSRSGPYTNTSRKIHVHKASLNSSSQHHIIHPALSIFSRRKKSSNTSSSFARCLFASIMTQKRLTLDFLLQGRVGGFLWWKSTGDMCDLWTSARRGSERAVSLVWVSLRRMLLMDESGCFTLTVSASVCRHPGSKENTTEMLHQRDLYW